MNTDDWSGCPQCFVEALSDYEESKKRLQESYGTLPMGSFVDLQAALGDLPTRETMPNSLREFSESYMTTSGEFHIYYGCSCEACDFKHEFTHTEQIEVDDVD